MNVHDSERLAGLLETAGYRRAAEGRSPDVVVFNTCAVRENADNRLYGSLGHLRPTKNRTPGMQIAVGGCLAQKDQQEIVRRAPWVDVVFGTHNLGSLPVLLERARVSHEAQVEIKDALQTFPSNLPTQRDSAYAAWVSISVGCNNTCTFCIVPALRGREVDRRPGEILAEIEMLVAEGVQEITLLGQNVNAYGVDFGDRSAFAKLLRRCGEVPGLERVRFTSPHPKDFTDEVIAAMAETPNVMPSLHMPLQSGSDRVLKAMRRSYRSERYLGILDRVRAAMPDAAITTDIIVGFPGETGDRLRGHPGCGDRRSVRRSLHLPVLDPPGHAGRDHARPGAEAGGAGALRPAGRAGQRDRPAGEPDPGRPPGRGALRHRGGPQGRGHRAHVRPGPRQPAGPCGRARGPGPRPRPGDIAEVVITYAAPHHLNADAGLDLRRTPGGDAWAASQSTPDRRPPVTLGLPAVGLPPPLTRLSCTH